MFGTSLDDLFAGEGEAVPFVLRKLCEYLEKNGSHSQGLSRVKWERMGHKGDRKDI